MGWMYTYGARAQMSQADLNRHVLKEALCDDLEVVAYNNSGRVLYAACKHPRNPGEVFAMVILYKYSPSTGEFGYKDMEETMGPFYYGASKKVLDALSPTEQKDALAWRERCREEQASKAKRVKLEVGMEIVFDPPLKFSYGTESRLTVKHVAKHLFSGERYGSYMDLKVPRIRHYLDNGTAKVVS